MVETVIYRGSWSTTPTVLSWLGLVWAQDHYSVTAHETQFWQIVLLGWGQVQASAETCPVSGPRRSGHRVSSQPALCTPARGRWCGGGSPGPGGSRQLSVKQQLGSALFGYKENPQLIIMGNFVKLNLQQLALKALHIQPSLLGICRAYRSLSSEIKEKHNLL